MRAAGSLTDIGSGEEDLGGLVDRIAASALGDGIGMGDVEDCGEAEDGGEEEADVGGGECVAGCCEGTVDDAADGGGGELGSSA